ncbi:MAG: dihydrolipoyl dehydrogenase [Paracoccaceae bacterium]
MSAYDVVIIGSGPGGYVAAIKAAQLGLKTACIEGRETLGGTCLNVGCIPSKALLNASEKYSDSINKFSKMGIDISTPTLDWTKMLQYKQTMIDQNTQGISFLFKKNKIDWIKGWARIKSKTTIEVNKKIIEAKNIILATGSEPSSFGKIKFDEKKIVSSTGILELKAIPQKLTIVGAGVIGIEMGSVFSRLGSEVTVIEYLDHIIPGFDKEISKTFQRILKRQGLKFIMNSAVKDIKDSKPGLSIEYSTNGNDVTETIESDITLISTGRKAFIKGLGLENIHIDISSSGKILVNNYWQTNFENIYAIGDVIDGPMLAHKAEDEGIAVAEIIAGQAGHVNYDVIPSVIYSSPEVAAVGKTEESLRNEDIDFKVGKFSFMGNGRAKTSFSSDGFVKILSSTQTDRILGAHIIGPSAGDLIHEICVAMEFGASAEDIARTCHAHPTYSEAIREAALACGDGAIHS